MIIANDHWVKELANVMSKTFFIFNKQFADKTKIIIKINKTHSYIEQSFK